MWKRIRFGVVLGLLLAGAGIVVLGQMDQAVSLSSVFEIWSDVLRDVDQLGLQVTRMSDREEMDLGKALASQALLGAEETDGSRAYVTAVGRTLAPHLRRKGIEYEFHVLPWHVVNAFALPGGQIYITSGMLEFLESEAELAAILGHEMSHVDQRHCVERFQYEKALGKVGVSEVGHLADYLRSISAAGYSKYQELEADAQGVQLCIHAGYYPLAAAEVFERLADRMGEMRARRAKSPLGELKQSLEESLGSYFDSHPPSPERSRRHRQLVTDNRRHLAGRDFYRGYENYRRRIPKSQETFPDEEAPRISECSDRNIPRTAQSVSIGIFRALGSGERYSRHQQTLISPRHKRSVKERMPASSLPISSSIGRSTSLRLVPGRRVSSAETAHGVSSGWPIWLQSQM